MKILSIDTFEITKQFSSDDISGSWTWVKTNGGKAGVNETPENSNKIMNLIIRAKKISRYTNNSLDFTTEYKIEKRKSIKDHTEVDMIVYNNLAKSISLNKNYLILFDEVYDGFEFHYVKD